MHRLPSADVIDDGELENISNASPEGAGRVRDFQPASVSGIAVQRDGGVSADVGALRDIAIVGSGIGRQTVLK